MLHFYTWLAKSDKYDTTFGNAKIKCLNANDLMNYDIREELWSNRVHLTYLMFCKIEYQPSF